MLSEMTDDHNAAKKKSPLSAFRESFHGQELSETPSVGVPWSGTGLPFFETFFFFFFYFQYRH